MVEYFIGEQHFIYIIIIFFNKYILAIDGQMADFFVGTYGYPGVT